MAAPTISPVGPAPSLSDLPNFPARADATLGALPDLVTQINAVVAWLVNEYAAALGNGSKAAPSLYFASDPDLGFYRAAANKLGLAASDGLVLDGLLSGLAVTQSATDTTAGRLLTVGDFGLGATDLPQYPGSDLNASAAGGLFRADDNTANRPANGNWLVINLPRTNALGAQIAIARDTPTASVGGSYFRNRTASGWQPWVKHLTRVDLVGSVSQSGGVPTGAVIERGSNANGAFVRLADGTQFCWSPTFTQSVATANGGLFMSGTPISWTPPAVFSTTNDMCGSVVPYNNSQTHWGVVRPVNATSAEITIFAAQSFTERRVSVMLSGRWF